MSPWFGRKRPKRLPPARARVGGDSGVRTDVDGCPRELLPYVPELLLRPSVLVTPSVLDIFRTEAVAQLLMPRMRPFETKEFVVQQQQLILTRGDHTSCRARAVTADTVVD